MVIFLFPSGPFFIVRLLRVTKLEDGDSGRYVCVASNAAGTGKFEFQVTVLALPSLTYQPPTNHTGNLLLPVPFKHLTCLNKLFIHNFPTYNLYFVWYLFLLSYCYYFPPLDYIMLVVLCLVIIDGAA